MASQSDVMNLIRSRVVAATAGISSTYPRTVYRGWPSRNQLLKHMQSGRTDISIFMPPGMEKVATRYWPTPVKVTDIVVDLYIDTVGTVESIHNVAIGDDKTFLLGSTSGTIKVGEVAALHIDRQTPPDEEICFIKVATSLDNSGTIVAALASSLNAAAVPGMSAIFNAGAGADPSSITVAHAQEAGTRDVEKVIFRIGGKTIYVSETKRQQRAFWVTVWAPSPTIRDAYGAVLDSDFGVFYEEGGVFNRLSLPDGTCAFLLYDGSYISDEEQAQKVWMQRFTIMVEFPTTDEVDMTQIVCPRAGVTILHPPSQNVGHGKLLAGAHNGLLYGCASEWVKSSLAELEPKF